MRNASALRHGSNLSVPRKNGRMQPGWCGGRDVYRCVGDSDVLRLGGDRLAAAARSNPVSKRMRHFTGSEYRRTRYSNNCNLDGMAAADAWERARNLQAGAPGREERLTLPAFTPGPQRLPGHLGRLGGATAGAAHDVLRNRDNAASGAARVEPEAEPEPTVNCTSRACLAPLTASSQADARARRFDRVGPLPGLHREDSTGK